MRVRNGKRNNDLQPRQKPGGGECEFPGARDGFPGRVRRLPGAKTIVFPGRSGTAGAVCSVGIHRRQIRPVRDPNLIPQRVTNNCNKGKKVLKNSTPPKGNLLEFVRFP